MWEFNGKHLMVDALCENGEALLDPRIGAEILEKIVEAVDMTMILPPVTVKFPHAVCEMKKVLNSLVKEGLGDSSTAIDLRNKLQSRQEESYGYSTFVMIAESHLTIHTFPEISSITFDCYSCKDFDDTIVFDILKEYLKIIDSKITCVPRALFTNN
jgi:S-adenosylmethionine decarboxylase